ncbi:cytochrome P450 monooxygenase [Aspergillus eucalypticola CBS 122712]|uniref:Cytochrome P450 monooxygenase n=1 Tax=Aspergillus eucalypticola (strain CBS 122712 / IBT 29274) TaxID=1448314 RepID=A0A317VB40_ASPEC|nr:cytochrome P450 monooxygenase [Aspergillus eucalypticola CBS 122712]PWY71436.1 cytochrome P450 monooxygenase [Aspergillus eucalypticola CBS 122712]
MIAYTLVLGFIGLLVFNYTWNLAKNIRKAQRSKLPYVVPPYNVSIIFMIFFGWLLPLLAEYCLPRWVGDILYDNVGTYRWIVRDRQVKRYGKLYMLVNPDAVFLNVADASVVSQIVNARQDFPKPVRLYKILDMYGPNVVTCEDKEWSHHRRYTATTFHEKNNALVWVESIQQTQDMIEQWAEASPLDSTRGPGFTAECTRDDIHKLTLNVLSGAGFGVKAPFKPLPQDLLKDKEDIFRDSPTPPAGFDFTFGAVVAYMNVNIPTMALANNMLPKWIPRVLVPFFKQDFAAHRDLDKYLQRLITTTESRLSGEESPSNLIEGMLISRKPGDSKDAGLSDREIISNMHLFTIAGHETTATTLRFAFVLLALHQNVQDWVYNGISEAVKDEPPSIGDWNYDEVFPKLVTPLCVMLETMRLYPPVITIPKCTGDSPSVIHYEGKDYVLEPNTDINLNTGSLHYSEEYWGDDVTLYRPQRWDARNKDSFLAGNADLPGLAGPGLEYPTIHKPVRGAYIPFSDGFRACLGKKFSQVEFVAALTTVLQQYRIELADSSEKGRLNAERVLNKSTTVITLAMREEVPLLFRRR